MIDTKQFVNDLLAKGVDKIAGVPCSFLGPLINEAQNRGIYEPFLNEGDALAYAAGAALAGHRCAVVMQNSGLSNAVSPLTSLNELFGLHTLLIIGNRGVDDEPQHRIMAGAVKPFLKTLAIPYFDAEDEGALDLAWEQLDQHCSALLVNDRHTFKPVPLKEKKQAAEELPFRAEILRVIAGCAEDAVIVTTTGFTSREMYCIQDRPENFYMVGSMGCLGSLASGIAEYAGDRKVIAVDGDSACLMRLGALYTLTQRRPDNLCYIVLDNEANESTGGQPNSLEASRLFGVMDNLFPTRRADTAGEVEKAVREFQRHPSYTQIYAKIQMGADKNLPRPERELIWGQAERFRKAVP